MSLSNGLEYSPRLRLKGFTCPWNEIKISDVFSITRGYVLSASNVADNSNDEYMFPVFSSQTKDKGLMGYYKDYLYENAITWTTDGANAGTVHYREGKFYCTNVCGVLLSQNGNANRCTAEILGSVSKKYVSYVGNPKLMNNVMADIKIFIPSVQEQQKIDSLIKILDQKIEKQQQLVELLKKYKKGLSNEFFEKIHADKRNGKIKFSDAYEIVQNNTFSRELLTTTPSKVCNIHYGDILTKYNSVLDIQATVVPFIKENVDVSKFLNSSYLREGDIIFADTAEDYTVGKAIEITKVKGEKILSGLHTIPCRPKRNIVIGYMGHYFNSKEYRLQILPLIQGTKVSSISKSELMKTQIVLPPTEEQRLITNCLSLYDSKIFIEEKIIEELKKLKASLLQQLFI